MRKILWLSVLLVMVVLSCKSQKENTRKEQTYKASSAHNTRIQGRVVEIINHRKAYDKGSPCAMVACEAKLVVEKIEQKGMDYHAQFQVTDTLYVHFAFTTEPTTPALFQNMDVRYPGIKLGESLVADLYYNGDKDPPYEIVAYQILTK